MKGRLRKSAFAETTRNDILEAAARVFARQGYDSAGIAHIAEEAGFSAAGLYTYFEGKQAILEALMDRVRDENLCIIEGLPPIGVGTTFDEEMAVLFGAMFTFAEQKPELTHLLITFDASFAPARREQAKKAGVVRVQQAIGGRIAALAKRDGRDLPDPAAATGIYIALGWGLFLSWFTERAQGGIEPFAARIPLAVSLFRHRLNALTDGTKPAGSE